MIKERKTMKRNFGKKNWMFPMPVLMIGTYNNYERGKLQRCRPHTQLRG
jgi:hypothetical protein